MNASPTQGLFFCPEEPELRTLTRHEADVALRQLTDRYYEETLPEGLLTVDNTEPRFGRFMRELSYKLDADFDREYVQDILVALDDMVVYRNDAAESDFNCAINKALDNTRAFPGDWINR